MEIREFFTEKEIRSMKERIIKECCFNHFISKQEYIEEDGSKVEYKSLAPEIKSIIKQEVDNQLREYVKEIINEIVKDKVKLAVQKFTKNLCDQLDKITAKTNWYWSIK
jgi:hypothetical protein